MVQLLSIKCLHFVWLIMEGSAILYRYWTPRSFVIELKQLLVTGKYLLFPLSSDYSFQFRQVHVTAVFKLLAIFSISNRPIEVLSRLNTILDKNVHENIKKEKKFP